MWEQRKSHLEFEISHMQDDIYFLAIKSGFEIARYYINVYFRGQGPYLCCRSLKLSA
jgi:hypothetical protein